MSGLSLLPAIASAQATTILASAARTSSGTAMITALGQVGGIEKCVFFLNVTAAATAAGDTLDVYLQSSPDGTTWDDFAHFTQVLGNGGAKKFLASWSSLPTPETELKAPADGTLAAGVLQGPVGTNSWRVKWVIVSADTPSFTFSITASPIARRR